MKMTIFSLALIGLLAWTANAACTLDITKSPTIRGFKLGMTKDDITKAYPDIDFLGYSSTVWRRPDLSNHSIFDNVTKIFLVLEGTRLAFISFSYSSIDIDEQSEFVKTVSDSLGLPRTGWIPNAANNTRLDCKGFFVVVGLADQSIALNGHESFRKPPQRKPFKP